MDDGETNCDARHQVTHSILAVVLGEPSEDRESLVQGLAIEGAPLAILQPTACAVQCAHCWLHLLAVFRDCKRYVGNQERFDEMAKTALIH